MYRVCGYSKRRISRELHVSRHTVDKSHTKRRKRAKPLSGCSMSLDALPSLTGVKFFFLLTASKPSFIWPYSLSGIAMADTPTFSGIRIRLPSWNPTVTFSGIYMVSPP